tara:strand:- start:9167 stop:9757 length:591 start_codon:yes stop_codon:yes gene_type:complete
MHKHYTFSDIFAGLKDTIPECDDSNCSDVLTNINFLNSKNATFNLFDDPGLYLILNFQNGGELVFQKNNHLEVDGEKLNIIDLLSLVDDERIKVDAIIDRRFIEFNYKNKVNPLELILCAKSVLNTKTEGLVYVERSIAILSSDKNGIPLYGFCCVNKIEEEIGTEIDKKNFRVISTSSNTDLSSKLTNFLKESVV